MWSQCSLAAIYRQQIEDGHIDNDVSMVDKTMNGFLYQSLDMVGNPPAPLGTCHLRKYVNSFQNQRGASWASVGNMGEH